MTKNNQILQIGITGGIGSGKSTICKVFKALDIAVYDADYWAKWLMEHNSSIKNGLKNTFGVDVYNEKGQLNRSLLSTIVFKDPAQLKELNAIVHPEVFAHYDQWVATNASKYPYLIKEAALMFESNSYKALHYVINVACPTSIRIARVQKRDPNRTETELQSIISKQMSDEERAQLAQKTIHNDGQSGILQSILDLHHFFHTPEILKNYAIQG
ncbi:MAG: Dephospho-CoA kinase [candidate division WS2 bacterium]|uniref:Dephospho-CoA kinase n=1 Tax=Psychracetigena formicireducens TaxID=2986056 RepID=A0A9E2BN22_PSYF1|nr:Dephospho-CoA kinase [Candidatus Psychracetigena formicireducens]